MKRMNWDGDKLAGKSNKEKPEQAILWQGGPALAFDAERYCWKVSIFANIKCNAVWTKLQGGSAKGISITGD